ncbi:MAG TPA: protein phosphatase 2C domain-containing protein, partial [Verrucomicrobiota bacterium]|nr:protein phosphatase 2C domain-containing protein [Verrucomicrobiota bacterium]
RPGTGDTGRGTWIGLRFDAQEVHHLGRVGEAETGHFDHVFAVSDGMGGAQAGEIASQIAVDKITTLLPRAYRQAAAGLAAGFSDVLEELYEQIHRALVLVGGSYEECAGMETTLSLGWFTPGWMYFGHIGDSRLYLLEAGADAVRQLSHDDTHVGWLFRQG